VIAAQIQSLAGAISATTDPGPALSQAKKDLEDVVAGDGARPQPSPRVSAEDRDAHREFVRTLGSGAVWVDYFESESGWEPRADQRSPTVPSCPRNSTYSLEASAAF
jgi:hypothetical protein